MEQLKSLFKPACICFIIAATFFSCKPTMALYDANAYSQAVSIKVDLQNLVDTASKLKYSEAHALINHVNTEIQKAIEYEKGRSKNEISVNEYEKLFSDTHSYKAFLQVWESQNTVSADFSSQFKTTIGKIMDEIIRLENGKNKSN
jgi:hypothetical protein